ncbi:MULTISPECIES: glutathione peroxidase [unclassified Mangrovimonas]|uniref:glutathione peroxidase n=1 Tax=unclassified Mangrovimonas TaxID=2622855 RepID=UPI0006B3FA64|nr:MULTISPECIES: glutathione peroxidase [unclassified Mangrovimonas]OMP29902.1 glutathione peroxidase [Mangrovimonas sp. DI 80]
MRKLIVLMLAVMLMNCKHTAEQQEAVTASVEENQVETPMEKEQIYQFKVEDLYGKPFDFASLKGKKIMIVNTASECGLTPQYAQLQELYNEFKDENFIIVGFPANNFGGQEPGSNNQIATFCKENYGVTFPMMGKISVKGDDMHEVYQFLTQKSRNGLEDSEVQWNFQKYLLDEQGYLVKVVSPQTLPVDESIINWIQGQ